MTAKASASEVSELTTIEPSANAVLFFTLCFALIARPYVMCWQAKLLVDPPPQASIRAQSVAGQKSTGQVARGLSIILWSRRTRSPID